MVVSKHSIADLDNWRREFKKQFSELPSRWELNPNHVSHSRSLGWNKCREKGQVQFNCRKCRRNWTSLNGVTVFHYKLGNGGYGEVNMELMGQKCKKCMSQEYQTPNWERQEIIMAVSGLLSKVKEKYYGLKSQEEKRSNRHIQRKIKGPHQATLCEACARGECTENQPKDTVVNINVDHGLTNSDEDDSGTGSSLYPVNYQITMPQIVIVMFVLICSLLFGWKLGMTDGVLLILSGFM